MSELHANGVVFKSRLMPVPPLRAANIPPGAGLGPHSDAGKWDSASPPSPKPCLSVLSSSRGERSGQADQGQAFQEAGLQRREAGGAGEGEAERREWDS